MFQIVFEVPTQLLQITCLGLQWPSGYLVTPQFFQLPTTFVTTSTTIMSTGGLAVQARHQGKQIWRFTLILFILFVST